MLKKHLSENSKQDEWSAMQVKEKHVTLPPLCSCPHDLSPLNPQYPCDCAINCPLYQNDPLYKKLLQSLLFNYDLDL